MLVQSTPTVQVEPATNRLGEPMSPFVASLLKLQQDAQAARDREFTAEEMKEYNAYPDAQDAELAARADESAEEMGDIRRFA